MKQRLNFSPRPFPARRTPVAALMLLNLLLFLCLAGSIWYWLNLRNENRAVHDRIDTLKQDQRTVAGSHGDYVKELERIDIAQYKKDIRQYHNIQKAYETHWGRLLDDLGAILPEDVRIVRLTPTSGARDRDKNEEAIIRLSAEARNKEAQLNFIRKLQEQPGFEDVRFESELYRDRGDVAVAFDIRFTHRPGKGA